jgi:hypothetical protein
MARDAKNSHIPNSSRYRLADRRELLKGLSLAGFAVGSATTLTIMPAEAKPQQDDARALTYRETDHIRTFYDLSRR